jgi:acetate kinase
MAMAALTLIANPGSASRKYALYEGERLRAELHFEYLEGRVICTLARDGGEHAVHVDMSDIAMAAERIGELLRARDILREGEHIEHVGLRIVAPSNYFLQDYIIDDEVVGHLEALMPRAPIHIKATLEELRKLRQHFPHVTITGISDSGFHATKPDYAWNYGISLEDADRLELKRYGYHGLSVASVVHSLRKADKLPPKIVVAHLGSGVSVTAVHGGKSLDTTMGYSPLEGVIMSTRSGSIDPTAVRALKETFHFDDNGIEDYLNNHSGLLGLGGSSDIRELLRREHDGNHHARLALETFVFSLQKAIGQMTAALGGVDLLAFTGTVGERSAAIRERVLERLHYLDLIIDKHANNSIVTLEAPVCVSRLAHSKPIYVVATNEAAEMVRHILK